MMSWSQTNPDGLYNYTVSYINAAYISFYNVDIHLYVGGGGGGGDGRLVGFFYFESRHGVCLIELLLYDHLFDTRIKCIVYNIHDFSLIFFNNIAVLPVYVRVGILLKS